MARSEGNEATEYLTRVDPVLGEIIGRVGPCLLKPTRRSAYEALVRSVVFQQLNGTAAQTILGRVLKLFPGRRFPRPEELLSIPEEQLRAAGLSGAKTAAVRDVARKTVDGVVPAPRQIRAMSDTELVERLTEIRGVGPWTVEMLLIFTLGRPDVLPVSDYGVRKGYSIAYGLKELPSPKQLAALGMKWAPHRSTAAWYLWRVLDKD